MIEYTLLNVLMVELKIYCGPDKFYGPSKFGQDDGVKNRAPSYFYNQDQHNDWSRLGKQPQSTKRCTRGRLGKLFLIRDAYNFDTSLNSMY